MKFRLLIISITPFLSYAQQIPEGAKHKTIIQSTLYNSHGDTSKYVESFIYFDSLWNELSSTNNIASMLDEGVKSVTVLDTPEKKIYANIEPNGDTSDLLVYLYDTHGNRTYNFQIRNGDTIVKQKRIYDANDNNIELYNPANGNYYLRFKASFNDKNELLYRETFDKTGGLIKIERYDRSESGESNYYESNQYGEMILQTTTSTLETDYFKTVYHVPQEGMNYGITLKYEKDGYSLLRESNDTFISLEIYNRKNKKTTSVYWHSEDL